MAWPEPADYQDAVQNPKHCFQDPELRAGKPAEGPSGPWIDSGNFASVLKVEAGGRVLAVRCFLHEVTDQQRRYALLSQHLKGIKVPFLVSFHYLRQGIQVQGSWYPALKMEWAVGKLLDKYVEEHLGHVDKLETLMGQIRFIAGSLRGIHLAHGDLQHGNMLVTDDGMIRLVDYDAMYCSAIARECGKKSPEIGHSNYQHPRRSADDFHEDLDSFSALVLYLSLRALISERSLWKEFYGENNLIFRKKDFETAAGPVFDRLKKSRDPGVKRLAEVLEGYCRAPLHSVGNLEKTLEKIPDLSPPVEPVPGPPPWQRPGVVQAPNNNWWGDSLGQAKRLPRPNPPPVPPPAPLKPAPPKSAPTPGLGPQPQPKPQPQPGPRFSFVKVVWTAFAVATAIFIAYKVSNDPSKDALSQALAHREKGDYASALLILEKARSEDPGNEEIRRQISETTRAWEAEKRH